MDHRGTFKAPQRAARRTCLWPCLRSPHPELWSIIVPVQLHNSRIEPKARPQRAAPTHTQEGSRSSSDSLRKAGDLHLRSYFWNFYVFPCQIRGAAWARVLSSLLVYCIFLQSFVRSSQKTIMRNPSSIDSAVPNEYSSRLYQNILQSIRNQLKLTTSSENKRDQIDHRRGGLV